MKHLLTLLAIALVCFSCGGSSPEEKAAEAAKGYYDRLAAGFPEDFLEGRAVVDSLPADYCEQLVAVYRKYMADVEVKHGGISEVRISPQVGRRDSTLQLTYAFLLLCFADSTQEEIVVPMVEKDGEWYMK